MSFIRGLEERNPVSSLKKMYTDRKRKTNSLLVYLRFRLAFLQWIFRHHTYEMMMEIRDINEKLADLSNA